MQEETAPERRSELREAPLGYKGIPGGWWN